MRKTTRSNNKTNHHQANKMSKMTAQRKLRRKRVSVTVTIPHQTQNGWNKIIHKLVRRNSRSQVSSWTSYKTSWTFVTGRSHKIYYRTFMSQHCFPLLRTVYVQELYCKFQSIHKSSSQCLRSLRCSVSMINWYLRWWPLTIIISQDRLSQSSLY